MSKAKTSELPAASNQETGLSIAGQVAAASLTGRFAHDLNNYLTTILGKAELALLTSDADRMKSALELGAEAARKSRDLVAHMQRFCASQRSNEWGAASPLDAVRPTLNILGRAFEKSSIALERRFGEVPSIHCDLGALSLAVYHVIRNAKEELESRGGGWLQVSVQARGEEVEIRVADDGSGLPADVIERSAAADFPSADPTSGGLAIAAWAARCHGGRLLAGNRPEGGAHVILRLPAQRSVA